MRVKISFWLISFEVEMEFEEFIEMLDWLRRYFPFITPKILILGDSETDEDK